MKRATVLLVVMALALPVFGSAPVNPAKSVLSAVASVSAIYAPPGAAQAVRDLLAALYLQVLGDGVMQTNGGDDGGGDQGGGWTIPG